MRPLTLSTMEAKLLAGDVSKQTHDTIVAQMQAPAKLPQPIRARRAKQAAEANRPPDASMIAGLLLGSPEFQRR